MKIECFDSVSFCGYEQKTTFFEDFSIADHYGVSAIKDTYRRAVAAWQTDKVYMTELVMVLNWKYHIWHSRKNEEFGKVYAELFEKAYNKAFKVLKGDDLQYFIRTTR